MPKYSVSEAAQSDLRDIVRYTVEKWSADQAVRYATGLKNTFQTLAESPRIGRSCDEVGRGLRRHEYGKHVVFYRLEPEGVRVVRILHQQMLPAKSRFDQ